MSTRVATFDAPAIAQKLRYRLSGVTGESADLKATIGRKSIIAQASDFAVEEVEDSFASLLSALAAKWNNSAIGEFTEQTATVFTDAGGRPYMDVEAVVPGVPFDVTLAAPYPTIDVDTVQEATAGEDGLNAIYSIVANDTTSGTWKILWDLGSGEETSSNISATGNAANIKAALVAGTDLTDGDIEVTGNGTDEDPWLLELIGDYAATSVNIPSIDSSNLTVAAEAHVSTIQAGGVFGAGSLVVNDTFTEGSSDVDLADHEADSEHTWTAGDSPYLDFVINPDGAGTASGPNANVAAAETIENSTKSYQSFSSYESAEIVIQADVQIPNGYDNQGMFRGGFSFRYTDEDNLWRAYILKNGGHTYGSLVLQNRVSGTASVVAIGAVNLTLTDIFTLKVTATGSSITAQVLHSGSVIDSVSVTSSDLSTAEGIALYAYTDQYQVGVPGSYYDFVQFYDFKVTGAGTSNEIQSVWTNGTSGTFTLSKPSGGTTIGIPSGASAATLKDLLEAVYDEVDVTGSGIYSDPWEVEFVGEDEGTDVALMAANSSNLTTSTGQVHINTVRDGYPSVGISPIINDTFTDDDATSSDDHTSDSSHTWSGVLEDEDPYTDHMSIAGNKMTAVPERNGIIKSSYSSGTDARITCDVTLDDSAEFSVSAGIMARGVSSGLPSIYHYISGYVIGWSDTEMKIGIGLQNKEGGSSFENGTTLFSQSYPISLEFILDGSSLTLNAEGFDTEGDPASDTVTYTSSYASTGTDFGLMALIDGDNTSAATFDNFKLFEVDAEATSGQNELQSVYLAGDGTFTLTKPGGGTTNPLTGEATTAVIKAALEGIGYDEVTITGAGSLASPWLINFGGSDSETNLAQLTGVGLGFGVFSIEEVQAGYGTASSLGEVWNAVITNATGGNFQLAFLDDKTDDIAYGANAAAVESALEALETIGAGNVTVSGSGSSGSPYVISLADDLLGNNYAQLVAFNEDLTGSSSITIDVEVIEESRGPWHFDDPLNWINPATGLSGLPVTGDDIVIQFGDAGRCFKYGIDQENINYNSITIYKSFDRSAVIGLVPYNKIGYWEYRPTHWKFGMQGAKAITIGDGVGGGSGLINMDTVDSEVHFRILGSSGPVDGALRAIQWKGANTASTVLVVDGSFATAPYAGESCQLLQLTQRDGQVLLGPNTTIGNGSNECIDKTKGTLVIQGAVIDGTTKAN